MPGHPLRRTLPAGLLAGIVLTWSAALAAQDAPQGAYRGQLGPLTVIVHFGGATPPCTLDSPNQGARGIPCADLRRDGAHLAFRVPAVNGSWSGTVSSDGDTLTGSWSQGTPTPLVLTRDRFVPAAEPSPLDGIWLGRFETGGALLRGQLVVESGSGGELRCTVDVIEQNAWDIGCGEATFDSGAFSFAVPAVGGRWTGRLAADGRTLQGTWTQRNPADGSTTPAIALVLERQSARIEAPRVTPPSYDPAIAPVRPAELESVLRRDLQPVLNGGVLASGSGVGVVVGVITREGRSVFALGAARPDALFEIGSITKTFTGLLLAQHEEQGTVRGDTPVRELLPAGLVAKPAGSEITLRDLAIQHSGLPRMPDNFAPRDPANPYADYDAARMEAFIARHGVQRPQDAPFLYSNLGFGLLGHALARTSGSSYAALLQRDILQPLGMRETAIVLPEPLRARFIAGHSAAGTPAQAWDLDAMAGAGALRATADDMLEYLQAQLDPARVAGSEGAARTLPAALHRAQTLQADAAPGMRIAYGWLHETASGLYWHNGGTGGFTSFAFFHPAQGHAGIVLVNLGMQPRGSLADLLGTHVRQRLAGAPAVSLAGW